MRLARLKEGAVIGEMALISDDPRNASVIADGDADALEMRREDLQAAADKLESVTEALRAFTRDRFLGNLTATHALFKDLDEDARDDLIGRFSRVEKKEGEALIEEGTPGPGIYLLLGGTATVSKDAEGERVHLATLRSADLCGEMSLVEDKDTVATVTASEDLEALFLSRDDFNAVVQAHPEVMSYLSGLTEERVRRNRALLGEGGEALEDARKIMV